jgi:ataxin-3
MQSLTGWSIFLVRGKFPRDCPVFSYETSNAYGQWFTPDNAQRITKPLAITHNASHEKEKESMSNIFSIAEVKGGTTSPSDSSND